jgi:thiol-disulfide isomerase/thioredoxin
MVRVFAILALFSCYNQDRIYSNSYKGKAPPELETKKEGWLNTEPLTLASLRGKVVWLEFGFIKCGPCRKMKPHLAQWHKELGPKGLVIIDLFDGAADSLDEVKEDVKKRNDVFPALWDAESRICTRYGVEAFPAAYLIGADGTVVWEGLPVNKAEQIEAMIKAELEKVKK